MATIKSSCRDCSAGSYGTLNCVAGPRQNCGCGGNYAPSPYYKGPCGPALCTEKCGGCSCGCGECKGGCCAGCGCICKSTANACVTPVASGENGCGCMTGDCFAEADGCAPCGCGRDCGCCAGAEILPADPAAPGCCRCVPAGMFSSVQPVNIAAGAVVAFRPATACSGMFECCDNGVRILHAGCYLVLYTLHLPEGACVNTRLSLLLNGAELAGSRQDIAADGCCGFSGATGQMIVHAQAGALLSLRTANSIFVSCATGSPDVFTMSIVRIG